MKKTFVLLCMSLVLMFVACDQKKKEVKDYSDFNVLYEDFQKFIAEDDLEGLKAIGTEELHDLLDEDYELHILPEIKETIAHTSTDELEVVDESKYLPYRYVWDEDAEYVAGYSTFAFIFEQHDGKWVVIWRQIAG